MNIHEYQAKELLKSFGVTVPIGIPAFTVEEAVAAAEELKANGATLFVTKAQIHAGGRGKGRTVNSNSKGVVLCKTVEEVKTAAENLLGDTLVTIQTGADGQKVQRIYITDGVDIAKEFYLGITLDRGRSQNVIMVSTEGGVEIEKVAEETSRRIVLLLAGNQGESWKSNLIEIRCLGLLEPKALLDAYTASDLLLSASKAESAGMTVVESSATGTPALVLSNGGTDEFVRSGESGLLADSESDFISQLSSVIRGERNLEALASNSKLAARAHNSLDVCRAYLDLYTNLGRSS
jgi:hypothetical protein